MRKDTYLSIYYAISVVNFTHQPPQAGCYRHIAPGSIEVRILEVTWPTGRGKSLSAAATRFWWSIENDEGYVCLELAYRISPEGSYFGGEVVDLFELAAVVLATDIYNQTGIDIWMRATSLDGPLAGIIACPNGAYYRFGDYAHGL